MCLLKITSGKKEEAQEQKLHENGFNLKNDMEVKMVLSVWEAFNEQRNGVWESSFKKWSEIKPLES